MVAMRHLLTIFGAIIFASMAAPAVHASPVSLDHQIQTLPDEELAYMKKWGRGAKGKKAKWRNGPPPWAPAHGLRRKRGY